jgi:ABC-type uncharacterized transport system substrate-binding protein
MIQEMTQMRRRIVGLNLLVVTLVAGLLGWSATQQASAHPHVFAKVRTELLTKDDALVGLRHTWIFDAAWRDNQLLEHDKDNDGKLTRAELAPLEAESQATLAMFRSFTLVRFGGNVIRLVDPRDVVVEYHGEVLGLTFTVSLAKPVSLPGSNLLLEVYDATWFSAYEFLGPDAVRFATLPPAHCTIDTTAPASPQQLASRRMIQKQMGPEFMDMGLPTSVAIACKKPVFATGAADAVGLHTPVRSR